MPEDTKPNKLGVDVAGSGDYNTFVLRSEQVGLIDSANRSNDTMTNVVETETIIDENGVSVGEKPQDPTKYKNIKAEAYWHTRMWILAGGKLVRDDRFLQLAWIKYKVSTDKVLQIEPKEDLKKRTGKSPDFAEAFMLTFVQTRRPRNLPYVTYFLFL